MITRLLPWQAPLFVPPLAALLVLVLAAPACADPLSDAFGQGATLGRSGSAAARGNLTEDAARSSLPSFTTTPPQTSYFGNPGLGTTSSAQVGACAAAGSGRTFGDQSCNAVNFSQTNSLRRPNYSIAPQDPLLTRAHTIAADPQAVVGNLAGNLAGTYSACTVQTVTRPDVFETQICHQYRTIENTTCDKILIVTPVQTPGCSPGQFLTRVTADPCPYCVDYIAFDFTCGANDYLMHAFTILKATGAVYMELGSLDVPGTLNTEIAQTPGPGQFDDTFCYQTYYSQSCSGANCSIGAWFSNPCRDVSYYGVSTFAMPTTVSFSDTWDNQCAALEARAR